VGLWIAAPALQRDETVRYDAVASLFKGKRRIGGRIVVTDQRFIFSPNRLDNLLGGSRIEFCLSALRDVRVISGGRAAMKKRGLGAAVNEQIEMDVEGNTHLALVRNTSSLNAILHP
jgi:hypothetical protein